MERNRTLRRLAALIWIGVGLMLAIRGGLMLRTAWSQSGAVATVAALLIGGALGAGKGKFVLSKTARRNRRRIDALEQPGLHQVFTGKTWLLVLVMIGLGFALRAGAARGLYPWAPVGGLYVGIGAAMLVSALAYFQTDPPPLNTRVDRLGDASPPRRGLLVVNLGTPDDPSTPAVRRYLKEFLGDRRVVEAPRPVWFLVLRLIILPFRGPRSAAAYRRIWTEEGSPLLVNSQAVTEALARELGDGWVVQLAMRYGNPSLSSGLDALREAGCEEVRVLPLFPQSSNTTTGTVQAEVARLAALRRDPPALSFLGPLYEDPGYIDALAARVREATAERPVDFHVFSFHGVPESYVEKGDPYLCHCTVTAFRLAEALGLERHEWELIFQSRFGDQPWLQPYADQYVPALAPRYSRVAITLPAFATDCLETLEEIGLELVEDFREAGGEELVVVPALNDHPRWVRALAETVVARAGLEPATPGL